MFVFSSADKLFFGLVYPHSFSSREWQKNIRPFAGLCAFFCGAVEPCLLPNARLVERAGGECRAGGNDQAFPCTRERTICPLFAGLPFLFLRTLPSPRRTSQNAEGRLCRRVLLRRNSRFFPLFGRIFFLWIPNPSCSRR